LARRCVDGEMLADRLLQVLVDFRHEVKKRLHLTFQLPLVRFVQVKDGPRAYNSIFLVVRLQHLPVGTNGSNRTGMSGCRGEGGGASARPVMYIKDKIRANIGAQCSFFGERSVRLSQVSKHRLHMHIICAPPWTAEVGG
jgi:hypothetical protein